MVTQATSSDGQLQTNFDKQWSQQASNEFVQIPHDLNNRFSLISVRPKLRSYQPITPIAVFWQSGINSFDSLANSMESGLLDTSRAIDAFQTLLKNDLPSTLVLSVIKFAGQLLEAEVGSKLPAAQSDEPEMALFGHETRRLIAISKKHEDVSSFPIDWDEG